MNKEQINKIIQDRLNDNQLSESPLTLKDIKVVSATLSRVLRSVFHKRIKYQETTEENQSSWDTGCILELEIRNTSQQES